MRFAIRWVRAQRIPRCEAESCLRIVHKIDSGWTHRGRQHRIELVPERVKSALGTFSGDRRVDELRAAGTEAATVS